MKAAAGDGAFVSLVGNFRGYAGKRLGSILGRRNFL